ncbi:nickel transport system permease protein [Acetoanaerobium pronyense]|uniref:Nickel transport system permease protein n=1 Tax=Acetoanaerobium pronyense TaxID=1482736 RepID=A0ABS4KL50_9FIRM|nr:ABC transporter permease subunit [Acetoanaerobium pronyense]MBP2028513.1 nickel transport system permease protein [Acetoanaerobium pronyense]
MKQKSIGLKFVIFFIISVVMMGIFAPWIAPNDPYESSLFQRFASMSLEYPFGTDHLGRCIFSRIIFGIRPTLTYAFMIMIGTMSIGLTLGLIAGYFGGKIDEIIMRLVDIILSFPSQIVVLAVVATIGIDIQNVVIATILVKWAWYCRMIRGSVLKFRESPFVIYSKTIGMPTWFILKNHILPNITADLTVLASLDMGWAILNISTLSFLGIGIQPPVSEWGAMLSEAKNVFRNHPVQAIYPGIALMSVIGGFHYLGDALRDYWDPKEAI